MTMEKTNLEIIKTSILRDPDVSQKKALKYYKK